ncbi:hypothetical protein GCM10007987_28760 [Aliivibrio fischeri]|nr:hypothetical protein GCM10007987_28760 [Aliivibrio fischeri]
MTLFSFQLFNLYYKELISKNYYTVLDITSDSFYKFRENTRDVFSFLEAKRLYNEAEKYNKKLSRQ